MEEVYKGHAWLNPEQNPEHKDYNWKFKTYFRLRDEDNKEQEDYEEDCEKWRDILKEKAEVKKFMNQAKYKDKKARDDEAYNKARARLTELEKEQPPTKPVYARLYVLAQEHIRDKAKYEKAKNMIPNPNYGNPLVKGTPEYKQKKEEQGKLWMDTDPDVLDWYFYNYFKPIDPRRYITYEEWREQKKQEVFNYPGRIDVAFAYGPHKRLYEDGKLKDQAYKRRLEEEAAALVKVCPPAERTNDPEPGRGELLPLENPPECLVRLWENQEVWTEERVQELQRQQDETLKARDGSRMRKYQLPPDEPRTDVYDRLWESQESGRRSRCSGSRSSARGSSA